MLKYFISYKTVFYAIRVQRKTVGISVGSKNTFFNWQLHKKMNLKPKNINIR